MYLKLKVDMISSSCYFVFTLWKSDGSRAKGHLLLEEALLLNSENYNIYLTLFKNLLLFY